MTEHNTGARCRVACGVIDARDPYGLLAMAYPGDEFEPEITDIVQAIDELTSQSEAIHLLSRVFIKWFGDEKEFSVESCNLPGRQLHASLAARGHLRSVGGTGPEGACR